MPGSWPGAGVIRSSRLWCRCPYWPYRCRYQPGARMLACLGSWWGLMLVRRSFQAWCRMPWGSHCTLIWSCLFSNEKAAFNEMLERLRIRGVNVADIVPWKWSKVNFFFPSETNNTSVQCHLCGLFDLRQTISQNFAKRGCMMQRHLLEWRCRTEQRRWCKAWDRQVGVDPGSTTNTAAVAKTARRVTQR